MVSNTHNFWICLTIIITFINIKVVIIAIQSIIFSIHYHWQKLFQLFQYAVLLPRKYGLLQHTITIITTINTTTSTTTITTTSTTTNTTTSTTTSTSNTINTNYRITLYCLVTEANNIQTMPVYILPVFLYCLLNVTSKTWQPSFFTKLRATNGTSSIYGL